MDVPHVEFQTYYLEQCVLGSLPRRYRSNLFTESESVSVERKWQPIRDNLRNFLLTVPAEMLGLLQVFNSETLV